MSASLSEDHYRVSISANSFAEAKILLETLLKDRLVAGGSIREELALYWWDEKIHDRKTFNITAYTRSPLKEKIQSLVKSQHSDKTPIIVFITIDRTYRDLLTWITEETHT